MNPIILNEIIFHIVSGVVMIALIVFHALYVKSVHKQYDIYMKAIMSKSLGDYVNAEKIEKEPEVVEEKAVEFVNSDEMTDKQFDAMIKRQASNEPDVELINE